jgi:hypothetical protein
MPAELSAIIMIIAFIIGFIMVVVGGIGFMRSNLVLMTTHSQLSQGIVFSVAAFMFVAGISVHFSGSSNTAFLRGQLAQTSKCELEGEAAYPSLRGGQSGIINRHIISCMQRSGFSWVEQASLCQEAPMATNGYCYEPSAWFDRAITKTQLVFN